MILESLKKVTQWSFCGKVRVAALRDALFLFEFSNRGDAQRVL